MGDLGWSGAGLAAYAPRLLLEWDTDLPADHRSIDGTLVFADVSGFTALSEQLERKGKVGAEQMVEILNHIFGELLRVAAGWGGEMLKFGGDALLLFFTGGDHARRAASAAHWMQRALRDVGRVQTGTGRLRLRMSVGMHSGLFDVFRVGGGHVELVIMGPATTVTVEMEAAADATEILLSRSTAEAVGDRCLGPAKAGGRLLGRAPLRKPAADAAPDPPDVDARRFVSPALLPYLSDGGGEPEHRQVTVAFLHIMGVDERLASDGPGAVASSLDGAMRYIQERLDAHNVAFLSTDVAADGTKLMVTAGAPFATGNDEERMLRALHEIVSAELGLPVRAGVNRGRVFSGDVGPRFRRTYTTIGDPTNTAARVMSRAKPGQLLTLAPVLDRSMTLFETTQLEPFQAKGKTEPLVPHLVGPPIGRRQPSRRQLPLLGRDAELAVMRAVLDDVTAGARRALEVTGQAGMGTSRLVGEALRASSLRAIVARCSPYDETVAYSGVGRLLTAAIGGRSARLLLEAIDHHAPHLRAWAPLLGLLLDVDAGRSEEADALDPAAIPSKTAEVLDSLVAAITAAPTAVVLEDAHWCDPASRPVLRALAVQASPGLVCLTRQPGPSVVEGAEMLEVGPLPSDAATALARVLTPVPLLPEQISALVRRSGGNPLFLSELVSSAARSDDLPESVEAFFTARIDRLDPDERAALRYAAVVGLDFEPLLVEKLLAQSGRPPTVDWDGLDAFVRLQGDKATFISVLARDAAYEALPFRHRMALHQEVGEALEDLHEAGVEELARHFHSSGDHDRTWRYARSAAERAEDRHAYHLAATFHRWAVDAGRSHAAVDNIDIAEQIRLEAEALRKAGRLEEASSRCHVARRLVPKGHRLAAQLSVDRGVIAVLRGMRNDARRWYRDADRLLSGRDRPEDAAVAARIVLGQANVAALGGDQQVAYDLAVEAAETARSGGDARTELAALAMAHSLANRLQRDDRAKQGEAALALAETLGDMRQQATVLGNLGVNAHLSGRLDEALDYYERTRDVAARSGLAISHSVAVNNIGEVHLEREDWARAEEAFAEAEMTARAAGHWHAHVCRANRGRAVARLGRQAEGRALLAEALEALRRQGAAGAAGEVAGWLEELEEPPRPAGE